MFLTVGSAGKEGLPLLAPGGPGSFSSQDNPRSLAELAQLTLFFHQRGESQREAETCLNSFWKPETGQETELNSSELMSLP